MYADPYNLQLSNLIQAKIIATNDYGSSVESEVGGTALVVFVPSEPLNLANDATITMGTSIGLTWTPSAQVGGTSIIDYQVWYDKGRGDSVFEILQSGVPTAYFTATGLTLGQTYTFQVKARNSVGFGAASASVTILAARQPDIPDAPGVLAPFTTISGDNVVVTWSRPYNGGSAIDGYVI